MHGIIFVWLINNRTLEMVIFLVGSKNLCTFALLLNKSNKFDFVAQLDRATAF